MGELPQAPPIRHCVRCRGDYPAGTYKEHVSSATHQEAVKGKGPSAEALRVLLDQHEEGVLYLICQKGSYANSIELAADYYEHTVEIQQDRVLEWNLIELLLDDLNKVGMVVYRLAPTPLGEVMVRIRATRIAYQRISAKYKTETNWGYIHIAGQRFNRLAQPLHGVNDKTDFRNHGREAIGMGPVVREDFIDHCSLCDHLRVHLAQLREMYGSDRL